jgi:hypothetical protein
VYLGFLLTRSRGIWVTVTSGDRIWVPQTKLDALPTTVDLMKYKKTKEYAGLFELMVRYLERGAELFKGPYPSNPKAKRHEFILSCKLYCFGAKYSWKELCEDVHERICGCWSVEGDDEVYDNVYDVLKEGGNDKTSSFILRQLGVPISSEIRQQQPSPPAEHQHWGKRIERGEFKEVIDGLPNVEFWDLHQRLILEMARRCDDVPLYEISYRGKLDQVVEKLREGADINARHDHYGTALHAASAGGNFEVVKFLLLKEADITAMSNIHGSALQAAAMGGHEQVVRLLLNNGADVNAQGGHYSSALQRAAVNGHGELAKLLLDKDADVNAQGGYYGNALQGAAANGHENLTTLLLDKGADVSVRGGHYGSALQAAVVEGHKQLAKLLLGYLSNQLLLYYGKAVPDPER